MDRAALSMLGRVMRSPWRSLGPRRFASLKRRCVRQHGPSHAAVDADVPVDGDRVLGKSDILRLMEQQSVQRETEIQKMGAEFEKRRAGK